LPFALIRTESSASGAQLYIERRAISAASSGSAGNEASFRFETFQRVFMMRSVTPHGFCATIHQPCASGSNGKSGFPRRAGEPLQRSLWPLTHPADVVFNRPTSRFRVTRHGPRLRRPSLSEAIVRNLAGPQIFRWLRPSIRRPASSNTTGARTPADTPAQSHLLQRRVSRIYL